ncbi:hypothetical protein ABZZ36_14095 [Actinacidiphila glaucinigra]|uniref:hypothetical protein n=1 Tax=Actinacidiphila glaucinigra TaxID=235986 RepID=UPI0033B952D0
MQTIDVRVSRVVCPVFAWAGAGGVLRKRRRAMATGETGFKDVAYDLVSVQYHSLKAGHDYGQYVRDAKSAGENEIADFFQDVMREDSQRAARCHDFLTELAEKGDIGPAASGQGTA